MRKESKRLLYYFLILFERRIDYRWSKVILIIYNFCKAIKIFHASSLHLFEFVTVFTHSKMMFEMLSFSQKSEKYIINNREFSSSQTASALDLSFGPS